MDLFEHPHRRKNPLTGEWILVSPQRSRRPWQGQIEKSTPAHRPVYDPQCYLCPGNVRKGGSRNPDYEGTYVFPNDFPALLESTPSGEFRDGMLEAEAVSGISRVICFSPRHDLTLPEMDEAALSGVVETWIDQQREIAAREDIAYVQIFENKGAMMGCSNPHPHGQIWASSAVPTLVQTEREHQARYFAEHSRRLLPDVLDLERQGDRTRIVLENHNWTVLVPFWATWPFETLLLPHSNAKSLPDLTARERASLVTILKKLTTLYDNLFECEFPYSMGWHQAPCDGKSNDSWTLHAHFYPPLLRSATVRKFMVGYEMLATPQRDITPEQAAERLRSLSDIHYKSR